MPETGPVIQSQANFWDFMRALVNLTLQSKSEESIPHTFLFDEERLIKLRSDMEDLINLEICMHMFCSLEANGRMQQTHLTTHNDTPVISAIPSPWSRPASPSDNTLQPSSTQLPLPHHFAQKSKRSTIERGHFRRLHSGQQIWIPASENEIRVSSASPSPQSSPSSTASTVETYHPTPLYLPQPAVDSAGRLRTALMAILASSNTSDRWTSLAPSLALQILRSTSTPLTALPQFESHLGFHLSNLQSRTYQEAEERVLSQLLPLLQKIVDTYAPLTSVQIFEAATTPKKPLANLPTSAREEIEDVATRIAHIGTLHWRVWAHLAYLVDPDEQQEDEVAERHKSMP